MYLPKCRYSSGMMEHGNANIFDIARNVDVFKMGKFEHVFPAQVAFKNSIFFWDVCTVESVCIKPRNNLTQVKTLWDITMEQEVKQILCERGATLWVSINNGVPFLQWNSL